MTVEAGTSLLHYRLIGPLGAGGTGVVWKAADSALGRDVAIKILPESFAASPERVARFEREARLLASLNHPHIAAVYGLHEAAGMHFLAMELVPGEDLASVLKRGPLGLPDAVSVARQIAEALEAAHESGVVHRDLKPANVVLRPDGEVKVLDLALGFLRNTFDLTPDGKALVAVQPVEQGRRTIRVHAGWRPAAD